MGILSKSKKVTTTSTTNQGTEIGVQGDLEGTLFNGSNNSVIDGGAFDLVGDVVSDSFGMVSEQNANILASSSNALEYGAGSQQAAYDFLGNALDGASSNQSDVFEWAAGQQQDANKTTLDFLDFADGETDDSLEFAGGLVNSVLDSSDTLMTNSYNDVTNSREWSAGLVSGVLGSSNAGTAASYDDVADSRMWSGGLINKVLDQSTINMENERTSLDNMLEWSGGLITSVLGSSEKNQESLRNSHSANLSAMNSSYNDSLTFAGGAVSKAVDTVSNMAANTQVQASNMLDGIANFTLASTKQLSDTLSGGLEAVKMAGSSESAVLNDKFIKMAAVGSGVLLISMYLMGRKK